MRLGAPLIPLVLEKLAGPVLRAALIALGVVSIVGGAYALGRHDGAAISETAEARITAAFWKNQADTAERLAERANQEILALQESALSEKAKADEYRSYLAKSPSTACLLSPDDVQRLRGIGAGRGGEPQVGPHASPAR